MVEPIGRYWLCTVIAMLTSGCILSKVTYKHVVFDENPCLQIVERASGVERNYKGELLKSQKLGLPIRLQLIKPNYKIQIETPINAEPVVFLSISSTDGEVLEIKGHHIKAIDGTDEYSFLVKEAKGISLRMEIKNKSGKEVGIEVLPYKIVDRGHTLNIDAP